MPAASPAPPTSPPKAFPARWKAMWRTALLNDPFTPDHPLAQAFAQWPASTWDSLYHQGRSALGWALLSRRELEPWIPGASTNAWPQYARPWLEHLLACGADAHRPFVLQRSTQTRRRSRWYGDPRPEPNDLRELAWSGGPLERAMGLLERTSVPLFAPHLPFPPVFQVLAFGRVDMVLAYEAAARRAPRWPDHAHPPVPLGELLTQVVTHVGGGAHHPTFKAQAVQALLDAGIAWSDVPAHAVTRCRLGLWEQALQTPEGPWLGWAKDQWRSCPPSRPPPGWAETVGWFAVRLSRPSAVIAVREALEELLPIADRPAWRPNLPDLHSAADHSHRTHHRWEARHWAATDALLTWAVAWGLPPTARTATGTPWPLWVLEEAAVTEDQTLYGDRAACRSLAWGCIETLVRHGCRMYSPRQHPRARGARPTVLSDLGLPPALIRLRKQPTFDAAIREEWGLPWGMQAWSKDYLALKRACALARKWDKVHPPTAPRKAPRL